MDHVSSNSTPSKSQLNGQMPEVHILALNRAAFCDGHFRLVPHKLEAELTARK